jgi:hypothetical protein
MGRSILAHKLANQSAEFGTMHHVTRMIFSSLTLCILLAGCSKSAPVAGLSSGGALSVTERSQLASIHPYLTNWTPTFSGTYVHYGATQHVYLKEYGIGSSVSGHRADALVFDSDGRLIHAGILGVRFTPASGCTLMSLSPLRFRFDYAKNDAEELTCEQSLDYAIEQFRKDSEEIVAWIRAKGNR